MLFMVIEQFRNQDGKSVYRRLRQKGRLMPDGLEFMNSWVAADLGRCFQLMECGDVLLGKRRATGEQRHGEGEQSAFHCCGAAR